jgi:hypothetical protein
MLRVANLFALLVFVVFLSTGFKTVFADDSGSGHDESVGEVSSEAEYAGKTETQVNSDKASEEDDTALKASEKLKARHHDVELVEDVPETIERKETDAERVPDIPETNPNADRTRSGNLDGSYGKSEWITNKGKNVYVSRD